MQLTFKLVGAKFLAVAGEFKSQYSLDYFNLTLLHINYQR